MHVHLPPEARPPADGLAAPSSAGLIARLQDNIRAVLAPCRPIREFALVDFPAHPNVGDAAIWLGELQFMRAVFGEEPAYVAKADTFDPAACRAAIGDGPIFIHGGGNFGDLWPAHQAFRLRLLQLFPRQPIIQLPQSIHFRDPAGLDITAQAIATHGNFLLLVRDEVSREIAQAFPCRSALCCDLAFWLGPQRRAHAAREDVLCLLRTDQERGTAGSPAAVPDGVRTADWLREARTWVRGRRLIAMLARSWRGPGPERRQRMRLASFETAARLRVRRGLRTLGRARVVVTDRLHAHILAVLLDQPHAVLDNSYGKLGRFIATWTRDCPTVAEFAALPEALAWAQARARDANLRAPGPPSAGECMPSEAIGRPGHG